MTFLNPFVLLGLAAAAIPVLFHLLTLRKLRTVEFSTLTFLKELQQTRIRRLKFRQLILLLIRILLVIFIVLAFARPALHGTLFTGIGTEAHSTILIIFDDSFSMDASDEHGERLKQAKDAADKLLSVVKQGDEIYFLKLSDLPKVTVNPPTHDVGVIRRALQETQVSDIRHTLDDGLTAALPLLRRSTNANRELYIISDMQKTLFELPQGKRADSLADQHTAVFLIPIGSKEISNTAVDSVRVQSTLLEEGKPASIYASFRNFSNGPLSNSVVSVYLDGTKQAQSSVSLEPYGASSLEFQVNPSHSGFLRGYVELENDALDIDNRRYFTMYIPDRINVTIVGTDDAGNNYLSLAIQAAGRGNGPSLVSVQQVAGDKLPQVDLNHVDVLICTNVRSFNSSDADRIRSFLQDGGGLILFPGNDIVAQNYNSTLFPLLDIPPIQGIVTAPAGSAQISFRNTDLDHPLLNTMYEHDRFAQKRTSEQIESPAITQAVQRQPGKRARTIISLSNGTPFLTEHPVGTGKVLFYSVSPTPRWSDFPFKALFAPIVYRSIIYVSPKEHQQSSFITGTQPTLMISETVQPGKQFTIKSPDNTEDRVQPSVQSTGGSGFTTAMTVQSPMLRIPGVYELDNGTKPVSVFAVNIDPHGSDTRRAASEDEEKLWQRHGIASDRVTDLPAGTTMQSAILQTRFGVELWRYCVAIALLLALTEMMIARDSRKALEEPA
ncbi:MAG TPA: BatA domain-containing protein [Bacteroidota bacterium]|nr:BatA domain-containing protein [Bacteroidota bacterium]